MHDTVNVQNHRKMRTTHDIMAGQKVKRLQVVWHFIYSQLFIKMAETQRYERKKTETKEEKKAT